MRSEMSRADRRGREMIGVSIPCFIGFLRMGLSMLGTMKGMMRLALLLGCFSLAESKAGTAYENDFQDLAIGGEPNDFLVLDGAFQVQADGEARFLELPGAPLDNFGALFGPSSKTGRRISVTIQGQSKGRLSPAFGVGMSGLGGFRLMVSASKRKLELLRGDEVIKSLEYRWKSEGWTRLVLEASPQADSTWRVRGKVWNVSDDEPEGWTISLSNQSAPPRGKGSIWGHPYSGYPIRFDDIKVEDISAALK